MEACTRKRCGGHNEVQSFIVSKHPIGYRSMLADHNPVPKIRIDLLVTASLYAVGDHVVSRDPRLELQYHSGDLNAIRDLLKYT